MRFGPVQNDYFKAKDGAYSRVTKREVYDSQITLTGEEVELVDKFFGAGGIHHGNVKSDRAAALKGFTLYGQDGTKKKIGLNLVYPKGNKPELRLYLKGKVFMPEADSIWFIFVSSSELCIGAMPEDKWRSLGRDDVEDENYIDAIHDDSKAIQYQKVAGGLIYRRDPKIAKVRFVLANYRCEVDPRHKLFTARSENVPYLESHHLLPMKYQKNFPDSLDVPNTLAALCPYCHRLIHHATVNETRPVLDALFSNREEFVNKYKLDKVTFYRYYNCEEILAD